MTRQHAAIIYTILVLAPFAMQIALAAGAPLGRYTVGGMFPAALPPLWRGLAVVQAALLAGMATVVLAQAQIIGLQLPHWAYWAVLALTVLTLAANAASPSMPERLLWTPVTLLMLLSAIGAGYLPTRPA